MNAVIAFFAIGISWIADRLEGAVVQILDVAVDHDVSAPDAAAGRAKPLR